MMLFLLLFRLSNYIHPDFIPAGAKPSKDDICDALDNIENVGKEATDSVPNGRKYFLYTSPRLRPIPGKDADKNIQNAGDYTSYCGENICNVVKYSFKDWSKDMTKTIPYCL